MKNIFHLESFPLNCHCTIRSIAIIAEGIPENMTRHLINVAEEKKVNIIGPATVGGIKPGCFKIGNTGGMMDNILHSKLYRHVCSTLMLAGALQGI